jgi:hypothetical protein
MAAMDPKTAILALLANDWTETRIAQAVGTTQPTINRIKHGGDPGYERGARLVELGRTVVADGPPKKKQRAA